MDVWDVTLLINQQLDNVEHNIWLLLFHKLPNKHHSVHDRLESKLLPTGLPSIPVKLVKVDVMVTPGLMVFSHPKRRAPCMVDPPLKVDVS
jgi:hypothetical protein